MKSVFVGALAATLWACGSDDGGGVTVIDAPAPDAQVEVDAAIDAPVPLDATAACATPDDCAWIDDELRTIVAVLSGAQPTPTGVTFNRRASVSERAGVRA